MCVCVCVDKTISADSRGLIKSCLQNILTILKVKMGANVLILVLVVVSFFFFFFFFFLCVCVCVCMRTTLLLCFYVRL